MSAISSSVSLFTIFKLREGRRISWRGVAPSRLLEARRRSSALALWIVGPGYCEAKDNSLGTRSNRLLDVIPSAGETCPHAKPGGLA
jgi:hypothetical protein